LIGKFQAIILAALVISGISLLDVTHIMTSDSVTTSTPISRVTLVIPGPIGTVNQFLAAGGQAAVEGNFNASTISVGIGSTVHVSLAISYVAGSSPIPALVLDLSAPKGLIIPAYAAGALTPNQRAQLLQQGKPIPDSLQENQTMTFSPNVVTLLPGNSATVDVAITIPANWPTQLIGTSITLSPTIQSPQAATAWVGFFQDAVVTVNIIA
jgi:hypothetical protein